MHQSKSRNTTLHFHQQNQSIHSSHFPTHKWVKQSLSNDATAYTINLPHQTSFSPQPNSRSQLYNSKMQKSEFKRFYDNKFTPQQNISQLLKQFEIPFWKILDCCSNKYSQLVKHCQQQYHYMKQILLHYSEKSHLGSYFSQMHINSTDTKINLLKMLGEEGEKLRKKQQKLKDQNGQIDDLILEVNKLRKISKSKDEAFLGQVQKLKELEQKIGEMAENEKVLKNKYEELERGAKKYKDDLKDKELKLKEMQAAKQNMKKQLGEIQKKLSGLNLNDTEVSIKPSGKGKSGRKICIKMPKGSGDDESFEEKGWKSGDNRREQQDLYRFLFIQACTIEEDLAE